MIAFIIGFFTGFIMCIPFGPINVMVMNTYLKKNKLQALLIASGGSVMDFVYFFIIMSGLSFFEFSERLTLIIKILGILFVFAMGVKEFFSKVTVSSDQHNVKALGSFLLGVLIYVSNPTLIVTMTALGAYIKSLDQFSLDTYNIILISLGLAIGSFSWFVCLIKFISKYENNIRNKYLTTVSRLSGALMIALSAYMGIGLARYYL